MATVIIHRIIYYYIMIIYHIIIIIGIYVIHFHLRCLISNSPPATITCFYSDWGKSGLMVNISRTIAQESVSNDPSYHQLLLVLRQGFLLTKGHLFGSCQHSSSFTLRVSAVEKIFLCVFGHISTFADLLVTSVDQSMCCRCLSWLAAPLNTAAPLSCLHWTNCKWPLMFVAD